jgi:hypothetical protein
MAGPPRPVFPSAPSEPSLRRLGVGGSGSGGDRPLRAQLVVALVVVLMLIAVPLYLWRRPSASDHTAADHSASAGSATPAASVIPGLVAFDAGRALERVRLAAPQRVKCGASAGRGQEGSLCDSLPYFEEALAKAIRENADCAPKTGKEGTINHVLTVDFTQRKLHVFPGASGGWKGPQARRATDCVKRALPAPAWDSIQHNHRFYSIAILATYLPPAAVTAPPAGGVPGAPVFE